METLKAVFVSFESEIVTPVTRTWVSMNAI